jgi:copper homeostasis protein
MTSARAAERGGSDGIELCEDLSCGGVTPSAGMIETACRTLRIPVHVLIRPRGGDFTYTADEIDVMIRDIATAKRLGARGVVFGVLKDGRVVNQEEMRLLILAARPLYVTMHKAFDACADPGAALMELVELGVDRVLTSGAAATARAGVSMLGALVRQSQGRITILAGGRVRASDMPALARAGVENVHVGSATWRKTEPGRVETREELVARVVCRAHEAGASRVARKDTC